MPFRFGIEHEIAFLNQDGQFADFTNTSYAAFAQIIAELPLNDSDYPQLRIGDAGIKHKRWYVEGFERFVDSEVPVDCPPKRPATVRSSSNPSRNSATAPAILV